MSLSLALNKMNNFIKLFIYLSKKNTKALKALKTALYYCYFYQTITSAL